MKTSGRKECKEEDHLPQNSVVEKTRRRISGTKLFFYCHHVASNNDNLFITHIQMKCEFLSYSK